MHRLFKGEMIMGKRFGRNQRRRLLERVEAAEFAETLAKGWVQLNREKIDHAASLERQLTMWARDILRLCGENSAFLRTWTMMESRGEPRFRFAEVPRLATFSPDMPMTESIAWQTIEAFVYTLDAFPDAVRQSLIIELRERGSPNAWSFALDRETFYAMPPRFEERMGERIAHLLAEHVRSIGRRRAA
jgi:hypothetical protein